MDLLGLAGFLASVAGLAFAIFIFWPDKKVQELDQAKEAHHIKTAELHQAEREHSRRLEDCLLEVIKAKGIDPFEIEQLREDLTKKYEDLEKSYQNNPTDINLVEIARRQVLDLDFPSAIGSLDQALAEEEKTKETSKARRASIYYEKGKIANLQLEYQKAKDYFSKAVELAPQTFEYNMSFGNIMITIGDFGFAQKLYKDALLLAQDDKEKGDVLNNLGTIYLSTKEYDKVILNLEEALSLYSKTLAEDSPSIAATLDNLGLALKRNGKIDEAIVCHKKALAKFRESLGDEHPSTARAYNNFASALLIKEEFYKAAENYDRSLNIKLKLYGEDHPAVASTLSNLGAIYLTIGENRHALEMTEKALKIFAKHLPAGHSNIAGIQHNIEIIKAAIAAEK